MKKIIVIGAGIGGLSAAIKLQNQGYNVEIYEKGFQPGGKMHQIKDKGFTFDVGPTIVMMPDVYRDVFRNAGRNPEDYIPMKRLDPMYDVYFKDDVYRHYEVGSDLVSLIAIAEKMGGNNAAGLLAYLSDIFERYQIALKHFISRPFRRKRDIYNPYMLYQAYKLKTLNSADKMMAQYIENKDLQQMLSFQTLYIGVSPKKGPSLYNIIPMIELLYGIWFIEGGMHTMALQMARLFEELGGKIHYGQNVSEIVIDGGSVSGIRVNESFVESDIVLSNADFPYTMKHLIKDTKTKGKYTDQKIEKMDYSCSCLIFYWGVKGTYESQKVHNFVICKDLDTNLDSIFDGRLIEDPSIYYHIPSNIDRTMAPEGHSTFYVLMPVPELGTTQVPYDEETVNHYRKKALEAMHGIEGLEDLESNIVLEHVYTPEDFEGNFNAYRGATFGLQPTLLQSNHFRPQSKSMQCEGLYFTGSSTHPGAGVPIVIEGGRIAADEIILDYGVKK